MDGTPTRVVDDQCLDELAATLLDGGTSSSRSCVGIAGVPGSGKSTLGAILADRMNRQRPGTSVLVPMDGFHLSNARLAALDLLRRKGAPPTFDAEAYLDLLNRARSRKETIYFPLYDRARHEPVVDEVDERAITPGVSVVLTEGNYLLLDQPPWNRLAGLLDACWFLDTPLDVARRRTIQRHVRGGRTPEDAAAQYDANDAVNAKLVLKRRRTPDLILRWKEV